MNDAPEGVALPPQPGRTLAQMIGVRNLLIIIITMPLAFLAVVLATLAIFGRPGIGAPAASTPETVVATLAQPAGSRAIAASPASEIMRTPEPLLIPRGGAVGAMALDGDRLALRIDTPNGGAIVVYDLERGQEIQRIVLKEERGPPGEDL